MGRRRLGECRVKRGEIRWYTFRLPDKRRPVLILTRNEIIDRLNEIIVVLVTRTIRGLTTEHLTDLFPVLSRQALELCLNLGVQINRQT